MANARAFIAGLQARTTRSPNNPFYKNKDRPLSTAAIQSFARALRAFSSWLYEDGYADTNVLRPLKPPKIQQKVVEVLSDAEIERLLAVFDRKHPMVVATTPSSSRCWMPAYGRPSSWS